MSRKLSLAPLFLGLAVSTSLAAAPLRDVYRSVKSSVVVIETRQKDVHPEPSIGLVSVGGLGSGVLISEDGKVATAAHVVQTADEILVHFMSGEKIRARVLGSEPAADVAVLQLERRPAVAQVARLGDSDRMEVGDEVFVVGAPLGITHSLTVGHLSARRLDDGFVSGFYSTEVFQTDAAVNQGNSGGPMFNMSGEVVGIVSYIVSQGGGFEGLGFAITSKVFRQLLLEERSPWSGIQGKLIHGEMARMLNLPQPLGLLVEVVAERSLGSHLGLRGGAVRATIGDEQMILGGDVLLEVMGVRLVGDVRDEIRGKLGGLRAGDEVAVKVLRGGQIVELKNYYFPDVLVPAPAGE